MDYTELADEFLIKMQMLRKAGPQKNINGALRGEAFILQYIAEHSGDVLPGEISNEMDVTSARVATALNGLENKGLITRQIDKSDRRKILVKLTPEGKDLAKKYRQTLVEDTAEMLQLLGEHDANEYVRITSKLSEILKNTKNHRKHTLRTFHCHE